MKTNLRTRVITKKQWDKFIPATRMAQHFRALAKSLEQGGSKVRAKAKVQIELAAEVKP